MKTRLQCIIVLLLIFVLKVGSQSIGDYRSATSGNYITLSTWQIFNGTTWVTPIAAQGFPGQFAGTGNVTIQSGHTITVGSAGIATQRMGVFTILSGGQLYLTGASVNVNFNINTLILQINATGSIFFFDRSTLVLPTNAVINVTVGGLTGDGCNNHKAINIGSTRIAACAGAPGNIYTFSQLMASSGSINALPGSNAPICQGATLTFTGNFSGVIGTTPTYHWSITNPLNVTTTFTTQNVSIPNALVGVYTATLTVTTILGGSTYSNAETLLVSVHSLPTLGSVSQSFTVCPQSSALIQLGGLVPNNTFELTYSIAGGSVVTMSNLLSSSTGLSSFTTASPLTLAQNGQTLTIHSIRITNPTTNCARTFTTNNSTVLSVFTTGAGTWTGRINNDWHQAGNWCSGVPNANTHVIIPAPSVSVPNQPIISNATATCGNITIQSGATLTIQGSNSLEVNGHWVNNGTFTPNLGTVHFVGTTTQQVQGSARFFDLRIANVAGVVAATDIYVDGVLNLNAPNPNETNGLLEMTKNYGDYSNVFTPIDSLTTRTTRSWDILDSWILYMGATATTIGTGDVTGKVKRTHIAENVEYSFGSAFTTFSFNRNTTGLLPQELLVIITKGSDRGIHANKTNAVERLYQIIRTGGTMPTTFSVRFRYLESELNNHKKDSLVIWDHHIPYSSTNTPHEHGKSSQSTTDNWLSLIGHGISYLNTTEAVGGGTKYWMFAHSYIVGNQWLGAVPTERNEWNHPSNWSKGNVPNCTDDVIIPPASLVPHAPTLPANASVKSITIAEGGVLNGGSGTLTICGGIAENGGKGSWSNYGTFNPGNSHVIFSFPRDTRVQTATISGITEFNRVTINAQTHVVVQLGAQINLRGAFINNGLLDAASYPNTIEYSGDESQTIVHPLLHNPGYFHLILSGQGQKVFQEGDWPIRGNLTLNAPITVANNRFIFNGITPQFVTGTHAATFHHFTADNASGITLGNSQSIAGILTLNKGVITTGAHSLTLLCTASVAGGNQQSFINGKLAQVFCGVGAKWYPIGKEGAFRPATIQFTSLNGTNTVTIEQFEETISGTLPINTYVQQGRYWNIHASDLTNGVFNVSLDGSPVLLNGGDARIVSGNGLVNQVHIATLNDNIFTANNITVFGNFAVAAECVTPVIQMQPVSASVCAGSMATFTVEATGQNVLYQWQVKTTSEGSFVNIVNNETYTQATEPTLRIANVSSAMNGFQYQVLLSRACGSLVMSDMATLSVNVLPTLQLSSENVLACFGQANVMLQIQNTTENPTMYRIDFDTQAQNAGFVDVALTSIPGNNTIVLPLPATTGSFMGHAIVYNPITGCESIPIPFTIHLNVLPQGSFTGSFTCAGSAGQLTWIATEGTGPFTVVYNDGVADRTVNNVVSGVPFLTHLPLTNSTQYTLKSVTGSLGCVRTTGFTSSTATITIRSGIWNGNESTAWNNAANWCGGIPNNTTDVLIPAHAIRQPVICALGAVTRDLHIEAGAEVIINDSADLVIHQQLNNQGTLRLTRGKLQLLSASAIVNRGMIYSQRTLTDALPEGKNWGIGTVLLNAPTGIQRVNSGIFNDLIMDSAEGVELSANANVLVSNQMSIHRGVLSIGEGRIVTAERVVNYVGPAGIHITGSTESTPNGTFIFRNPVTEPVQATVSMFSKAAATTFNPSTGRFSNYKWQYFGIPLRSVAANPTFAGSFLRRYSETVPLGTSQWISLQNNSVLTSFRPYQITQPVARTIVFRGILENRDTVLHLTYTPGSNYPGQHLIANPYTAAIQISQLNFGAATEETVYLYNTGSFADWLSHTTFGESPGQYVAIPKNLGDPSIPSGLPWEIPSMQGFLIRKREQNNLNLEAFTIGINYTNTAIKGTAPQRVRSSVSSIDRTTLPFTSIEVKGARYNDKMWLFDVPGTTQLFDNGWDGSKMFGTTATPQLFAAEPSGNYQVSSKENMHATWLGFRSGEDVTYTLHFQHHLRMTDRFNRIFLTDVVTNTTVDISQSGSVYTFNAVPGTATTNRFFISVLNSHPGNNEQSEGLLSIISQGNQLFVENRMRQQGVLRILTLSGTSVFQTNFKGNGRTNIRTQVQPGVYVVEAVVQNIRVKRVVFIP